MGKKFWTDDELTLLESLYMNYVPMSEIVKKIPRHTAKSISNKALKLGLTKKYIRQNNASFKAIYQDYEWCFDRYINHGMSFSEMAEEANCTKRVIFKWCNERYHINEKMFKETKKLTRIQKEIISIGTIGDGHIDRRVDQPIYIESHANDEKDYLFWKYSFLKDLCIKPPVKIEAKEHMFSNGKMSMCQAQWRLSSRIVNDLKPIREMSRYEKLKNITEFQLCLLMLDDGSRGSVWELCVASWTQEEIEFFLIICKENFCLQGSQKKDSRYVCFDSISSKRIDAMVLENVPNELDIVKKKIVNNKNIREPSDRRYVVVDLKRIGVSTYCKTHNLNYKNVSTAIRSIGQNKIEFTENEIIEMARGNRC